MKAGELRRRILAEHEKLRGMLDALTELSEGGDETVGATLREEAHALYEAFAAHLLHEEHTLEPALRRAGAAGAQLAEELAREHCEQRELLVYLVSRLEKHPHPTLLVAREVRSFIESVRLDMAHEETTLLSTVALPEE